MNVVLGRLDFAPRSHQHRKTFLEQLKCLSENKYIDVEWNYNEMEEVKSVTVIARETGSVSKKFTNIWIHLWDAMEYEQQNDKVCGKGMTILKEDESYCGIRGCRSGCQTKTSLSTQQFTLPAVFTHIASNVSPVVFEDAYENDTILSGPTLERVLQFLPEKSLSMVSQTCRRLQFQCHRIVPGLVHPLYPHQERALQWMRQRELQTLNQLRISHPLYLPPTKDADLHLNLQTGIIAAGPAPRGRNVRGGLLCDEPGLGKTITMIALILKSKGTPASTAEQRLVQQSHQTKGSLRFMRSKQGSQRRMSIENVIPSKATLIVCPDALLHHWTKQMEDFVDPRVHLKIFVDNKLHSALPDANVLCQYDLVLTTFKRLGREWKSGRPVSEMELREPDRFGYSDGPRTFIDGNLRGSVSELLKVHWLRVIFDEGHKLGSAAITNQIEMSRCLTVDRRWVMTGTPTPNTMKTNGMSHLHSLLSFLRISPYGDPGETIWNHLIARGFDLGSKVASWPFESELQKRHDAWFRLYSVLQTIMLRHTKASISKFIPRPIHKVVYIIPSKAEHAAYNVVVSAARTNLVLTNKDPKTPGALHRDSLLNPKNRKFASEVMSNLRTACCGTGKMGVHLQSKDYEETIQLLRSSDFPSHRKAQALSYVLRARAGEASACESCRIILQLMMLTPCGHICCAKCVETHAATEDLHPICPTCQEPYDWEKFQVLQPGFSYNWQTPTLQKTRPMEELIHDTKALYVSKRIAQLRQSMTPKVIVFSQFTVHLHQIGVSLRDQGIPYATFMPGITFGQRMKALHNFEHKDNVSVLLLADFGSHGLDLSFVTHILITDEIWDQSIREQVISRAHRLGATNSVIVEQLVMEGTIETYLHDTAHSDRQKEESDISLTAFLESDRTMDKCGSGSGRTNENLIHSVLNQLEIITSDLCTDINELVYRTYDVESQNSIVTKCERIQDYDVLKTSDYCHRHNDLVDEMDSLEINENRIAEANTIFNALISPIICRQEATPLAESEKPIKRRRVQFSTVDFVSEKPAPRHQLIMNDGRRSPVQLEPQAADSDTQLPVHSENLGSTKVH